MIIILFILNWSYKNIKDIVLTDEEKKILDKGFTKISKLDIETCFKLMNNYKVFVKENKYSSFERTIRMNASFFNSLFEEYAIELFVIIFGNIFPIQFTLRV